jgi:hypothetical protein
MTPAQNLPSCRYIGRAIQWAPRSPRLARAPARVCENCVPPQAQEGDLIRWARAEATAATLARLHIENAALRRRVAEQERLVGQLKRRLWPRPGRSCLRPYFPINVTFPIAFALAAPVGRRGTEKENPAPRRLTRVARGRSILRTENPWWCKIPV